MKQLLYIAFIAISFAGFSQEKGPICSIRLYLHHQNDTGGLDRYWLTGNRWNLHKFTSKFQIDSINPDIVELTLFVGDSLNYHAGWTDWGPCIHPDLEAADVESVITIIEGETFPITTIKEESFSPDWDYTISQDVAIRTSCLLELKSWEANPTSHFLRVKFIEPPVVAGTTRMPLFLIFPFGLVMKTHLQ